MLYREHLAWTGFELKTLVVIGTDRIGSYKSNYYKITTITNPFLQCSQLCTERIFMAKLYNCQENMKS